VPANPSRLPQQFRQQQNIYYTPKNIIENEHEDEAHAVDPNSIGLKLKEGEKIVYYQKPAFLYMKNVLILFIVALLFFTILLLVPLYYLFPSEPSDDGINDQQSLSRTFILYVLAYAFVGLYAFVSVYLLFYKLLYKRITTRYILTNKRVIISRGWHQLETLLQRIFQREKNEAFFISWKYKEISELHFTLHNSTDGPNSTAALGNVYFGYKVDRTILPFSVVTFAITTGFPMVPDVYHVLDILIHQLQQHHTAVTSARLIKDENDPTLRSYLIARTYGLLCGMNLCWCCITRKGRPVGKISEEEYRSLTYDAVDDIV
jgi:ABC-type multidrug transport system fused ATPase/permease subunit